MKVSMSDSLYRIVRKNYVSLEYVIGEVLPMVEMRKVKNLPLFLISDDNCIEVEIDDTLLSEMHRYFNDSWNDSQIINYLLSIGFALGV